MTWRITLTFAFVLLTELLSVGASPQNYTVHSLNVTPPGIGPIIFQQIISVIQLGLDTINNDTSILPDTKLTSENFAHFGSAAVGIKQMMTYASNDVSFVMGNFFVDVSAFTAIVGDVFDIAQLSPIASGPDLSNDRIYPLYSRLTYSGQGEMIRETILHYASIQGKRGWDMVAVISTTDVYGVTISNSFIENIGDEITIATYQQYLLEDELGGSRSDIELELNEILRSDARIIVAVIVSGHGFLIDDAMAKGLIGDNYVWFFTDTFLNSFQYSPRAKEQSRGMLAVSQHIPEYSPEKQAFEELFHSADPTVYFGAGPGAMLAPFVYLTYDMVLTVGHLVDKIDRLGLLDTEERISGQTWTDVLRTLNFTGVTGRVSFNEIGDREAPYSVLYMDPETGEWHTGAIYNDAEGYSQINDVIWYSNTTEIPDLDIREPYHYWSCHDGELEYDPTGKEVELHTPDGSDIDDIDSDYHCDHFIDCQNFSDESKDCASNYTGIFIAFGIVTGLLILLCLLLTVFVFVFGIILKYRRLRVASPFFLLLLLISMIIGYGSIYAWFGKPHTVACAFQPWLLGLASTSMIAALCAKNYRIWRIFQQKMQKQRITDFELLVLWFILMLPVVLILVIWTIVSTPKADMKEMDGKDHYVCTTGGFTGEPGGLVFFFILVAYTTLILFFGVFLSIVTRKVPSMFNESQLLAISIYNLGFLAAVIIPVFLVIHPINPFIAWILRTVAILYAFTATLVLQFLPPLIGIIVIDKGKNIKIFKSSIKPPSNSQSTLTSPRGSSSGKGRTPQSGSDSNSDVVNATDVIAM